MARPRRSKKKGSKNKANADEAVVILPYNLEEEVNRLWLESFSSPSPSSTLSLSSAPLPPGDDDQSSSSPPVVLGIPALLDLLLQQHPNCPAPLKRQIKAAKNVIPYRKVASDIDNTLGDATTRVWDDDLDRFVQQSLEQRSNFKAVKRWDEVNELTERLQAMGVEMDHRYKTWKVGTPIVLKEAEDNDVVDTTDSNKEGEKCQMCGRLFGSKNLVFRHLRDPTSSCGNSILGSGESLEEPPSAVKKQNKQQQQQQQQNSKHRKTTPKTGATARHAPPDASVWMGDLPLEWTKPTAGQYKHLKAFLFRYSPRHVLPPWIKIVIRKAYRSKDQQKEQGQYNNTDDNTDNDKDANGENGDKDSQKAQEQQQSTQRGSYLGYAILVYRDAAEANLVMSQMNHMTVLTKTVYPMGDQHQSSQQKLITEDRLPNFVVRVRPAAAAVDQPSDVTKSNGQSQHHQDSQSHFSSGSVGLDPPILRQLQPLPMEELQRRYLRLGGNNDNYSHLLQDWEEASSNPERRELVVKAYTTHYSPRKQVRIQGKCVPEHFQKRLLKILQALRWPAENHRAGLTAERYLVLTTSSQSTAFEELRQACRDLMQWADMGYYYSGIAVTKNFVASPHIDDRDQSFQYALSLGNFESGGELCVEGTTEEAPSSSSSDHYDGQQQQQPDFVNVVETHNRIARVDGRHVHWVRTWQGGDRYSLIFYDTSDRFPTPIIAGGVDLNYIK